MRRAPRPTTHRRIRKGRKVDNERNIVFKETAIYKPLIYVFFAFLSLFVVLFPNSIFDKLAPEAMSFFRQMAELAIWSGVDTLLALPLPFPVQDTRIIAMLLNPDKYNNWFALFLVFYPAIIDTLFAILGYRFVRVLSKLFVKKDKKKKDRKKMNALIDKYGSLAMFLAASTPLPFSVAIYYAGAVKMNFKDFVISTLLGRIVKYGSYALFLRAFGIDIIEFGKQLLDWFLQIF